MNRRLRYLGIALRNMRGPLAVVPLLVMPLILAGWIVGVILAPGPVDPHLSWPSWLAVASGFAVLIGHFQDVLSLRSKYPPLVLAGGGLCVVLSIFCLWREPSLGLLIRLSLPLLLTGIAWFYSFYFSVLRGKNRISRLKVGDRFPDFDLPDTQNQHVTLPGILTRGRALMLFYKGDW